MGTKDCVQGQQLQPPTRKQLHKQPSVAYTLLLLLPLVLTRLLANNNDEFTASTACVAAARQ
jgi:hypothetical protein